MSDKGNCPKHGEFVLMDGCAQCLAEQHKAFVAVPKEEVTNGLTEEEQDYEATMAYQPPMIASVAIAPNQDTEVLKLREEILTVRDCALAMVVKTPQDAKVATNDLSIISNLKISLIKKRKEFVAPLQTYIKEINDAFKLISEPLVEADKAVRDKVLAYKVEQERLRQQAENAARLQREADEAAREVREATGEKVPEQMEALRYYQRFQLGFTATWGLLGWR